MWTAIDRLELLLLLLLLNLGRKIPNETAEHHFFCRHEREDTAAAATACLHACVCETRALFSRVLPVGGESSSVRRQGSAHRHDGRVEVAVWGGV